MGRYAHDSGVVRHVTQYDGAGANAAIFPHSNVAQDLRSTADDHAIVEGGVTLSVFLAGTAESYSLIQSHVVTDRGGLADHDSHTVINEQSPPDLRPRMNLYPRNKARQLRKPASGKKKMVIP
jgi:hypothetical protein